MEASVLSDIIAVSELTASAYTIPTDAPESDGTFQWDATTLVLVEVRGGDHVGTGYAYTHASAVSIIADILAEVVEDRNAMDVVGAWHAMQHAVRNAGRDGVVASAIAAVDAALWDLKARLLGRSLVDLFGAVREGVPLYGSGGFTSYSVERLQEQFGDWIDEGFTMVKLKVGRQPDEDIDRVEAARVAVGDDCALFVDANGAYGRKEALWYARAFADLDVTWFEEPVSSDDLDGLRLLRDQGPPGMDIAAGEYGYNLFYFRRMLEAGAVDVLQVDATRCAGLTGFLQAATFCEAYPIDLSAHTAPNLHAHVGCATMPLRHVEYFHDHARLEQMLFDGALQPQAGRLVPDRSRLGMGFTFKHANAARFKVA